MMNKGVYVKSVALIAITSIIFSAVIGSSTSLFDIISSILDRFGIKIHDNQIELNGHEVNFSRNTSLAMGEDGGNGGNGVAGADGKDGQDGASISGVFP